MGPRPPKAWGDASKATATALQHCSDSHLCHALDPKQKRGMDRKRKYGQRRVIGTSPPFLTTSIHTASSAESPFQTQGTGGREAEEDGHG